MFLSFYHLAVDIPGVWSCLTINHLSKLLSWLPTCDQVLPCYPLPTHLVAKERGNVPLRWQVSAFMEKDEPCVHKLGCLTRESATHTSFRLFITLTCRTWASNASEKIIFFARFTTPCKGTLRGGMKNIASSTLNPYYNDFISTTLLLLFVQRNFVGWDEDSPKLKLLKPAIVLGDALNDLPPVSISYI